MGGGFGPIIVSGQIILDHDVRQSVSIGDIAEIPVCIIGLLTFAVLGSLSPLINLPYCNYSSVYTSLIGPHITRMIGQKNYAEKVIGLVSLILGFTIILKIIFG